MAHEVFISHAEPDRPAAEAIRTALEKRVILCWTPPAGARRGDEWNQAVTAAIRDSSVMLLIFTSRANDSMQVRRELERAVTEGVPILPVSIEAVAPEESLDSLLGPVEWMDASKGPLENHLEKICRSVAKRLGRELGPLEKNRDEGVAEVASLDRDMRVAPPPAEEDVPARDKLPPARREQAPRQSPPAVPPAQSPHQPPLASTPPAPRTEPGSQPRPAAPNPPAAPVGVAARPAVAAQPPASDEAQPVMPVAGSPRVAPVAPPRALRTEPSPSQPAPTIPATAPVAESRQAAVPMASQLTPAPMNRRIAAAVADTIVSTIGLAIMAASAAEGKDPPAWFATVSLLFPLGYWVISEGLGGATPGKRFLRLRVVSVNGGRCTFMQAWKRTLLRMVDYLPFFYLVGFMVALRNPLRQRLGDRWAGTMVIHL